MRPSDPAAVRARFQAVLDRASEKPLVDDLGFPVPALETPRTPKYETDAMCRCGDRYHVHTRKKMVLGKIRRMCTRGATCGCLGFRKAK